MIKIYKLVDDLTEQDKKKIIGSEDKDLQVVEVKTSPTQFAKDLIYDAIEDINYKIFDNEELTEREQKIIEKQVARLTKQLMKKL